MMEMTKACCRAVCFISLFVAIEGTVADGFSPDVRVVLMSVIGLTAFVGWLKSN